MRIIAGKFKGRRLKTPKGDQMRPTTDRVKESLFRIFRKNVIKSNFLDLCAGSGNIGIEALSRGAGHVTFVERSSRSISIIRANLELCGYGHGSSEFRIIRADLRKAIAILSGENQQFDLIYFDPPYDSDLYEIGLKQIAEKDLLSKLGVICIEIGRAKTTESIDRDLADLHRFDHRNYGDINLLFYKWSGTNE